MTRCHQILVLLILAAILGCGKSGPKQTLVFQATPLRGAAGLIDLDTTKRLVKARIAAAKIRKRSKVDSVGLNQIEVIVYGATPEELETIKSCVASTFTLEFAAVAHNTINADVAELANEAEREVVIDGKVRGSWVPVQTKPDGKPKEEFADFPDVLARDRDDNGQPIKEWLVVYDHDFRVTGDLVEHASEDMDQLGKPCITFKMNAEGAANIYMLTNDLRPKAGNSRRLAIILDGKIHSAPTVQSAISARGQITGDFTQEEVARTVMLLRTGSFPCQLKFSELKQP